MALDSKFARAVLLASEDPNAWADELEIELCARLRGTEDFDAEVSAIMSELRTLGHDLVTPGKRMLKVDFSYDHCAGALAQVEVVPE